MGRCLQGSIQVEVGQLVGEGTLVGNSLETPLPNLAWLPPHWDALGEGVALQCGLLSNLVAKHILDLVL